MIGAIAFVVGWLVIAALLAFALVWFMSAAVY